MAFRDLDLSPQSIEPTSVVLALLEHIALKLPEAYRLDVVSTTK